MNSKKFFLVVISIGAILMVFTSCATSKKSYSKDAVLELITGEWTNTESNMTDTKAAKRVIDQDGALAVYNKTYDETAEKSGKITITKAWTETEGWLWFKDTIRYEGSDTTFYELSKLNLEKMDWTLLWSEDNSPAGWDAVEYPSLFYRKYLE